MAATNKCLALMSKSLDMGNATIKKNKSHRKREGQEGPSASASVFDAVSVTNAAAVAVTHVQNNVNLLANDLTHCPRRWNLRCNFGRTDTLAGKLNADVFAERNADANGLDFNPRVEPKAALRAMLKDPRAARGFRSTGQLEKAISADRSTTERLLLAVGARKSDLAEEWTLNPL
jgi:hypothetical protein